MTELETPVLIVGGGPVGLALAFELRLQGIDPLVLEQSDNVVTHPRVSTIGPRSMEFCRRWGLADDVRRAGWPEDHPQDIAFVTQVGGHEILRIRFPSDAERPLPECTPEPEQVCPQHWFIPLLSQRLNASPEKPLRLRCRLETIRRAGDGIVAHATDLERGETLRIYARYVAACDGARSGVRKALGLKAPARHPTQVFLNVLFRAPRLAEKMSEPALVYFLRNPRLQCPLRVIDGRGLYRLTVNFGENEKEPDAYESVLAALAVETPVEVLSCDRWYLTHRVVERFRDGPIFLVGDAAHSLSPSGGFGMNTGIADAVNLAWKLAAVLQGWGGPGLLDTYEAEQKAIAERNLEEANANLGRTQGRSIPPRIMEDSAEGARFRSQMAERMLAAGIRREFDAPGIHLGAIHRSCIIVSEEEGSPPSDDPFHWTQSSYPGARAPHAWIGPGRSTLDLFGRGFVLMHREEEHRGLEALAEACRARGVPLKMFRWDTSEGGSALYPRACVLVRPDGHIAWRGDTFPTDVGWLVDRVRGGSTREVS